ncbi:MAG: hypothetical protein ACTHMS_14360, partial [Jatrophihabitans sp.]
VPMTRTALRVTALAAAAATTLVAPAAAGAATTHRHHAHRHAPAVARIHGLVVSRQGKQLTVLADTVTLGKHRLQHVVEHVSLRNAAATAARAARAGYVITGAGAVDRRGITNLTVQAAAPQAASVVLGTVASVDGSLATICAHDGADGHHGGGWSNGHPGDGQGDGQGGGAGGDSTSPSGSGISGGTGCGEGDQLTVDLSDAALTGTATSAAQLAAGDYLVALGEQLDGTFLAAQAISYAAEPSFVVGRVLAADANANSLSVGSTDGDSAENTSDDGNGDGSSAGAGGVQVDTTTAQIVVNGAQDGTFPSVGDEVLVLGQDGVTPAPGAPLPSSFVYAFNQADHNPAGDQGTGDAGSSGGD